jgi:hypothetical protein
MICLEQAFRCNSRPVLFRVDICMMPALLLLRVDSGAGWISIVASGSALLAFTVPGAGRVVAVS